MPSLTGIVAKRGERSGVNKFNKPWTAINLLINDEWYGGYVDRMPVLLEVSEGDEVSIEYNVNGNYKILSSCDIVKKAERVASPAGGGATVSVKELDRQWHISLGGALHDAATIVKDMLDVEAISLPAAKNKKYDAYMGYVRQVATDLATFNLYSEMPDQDQDGADENPFNDDISHIGASE